MKKNAAALGEFLKSKGYNLVTDGTDNHLVLWDLRPLGLTGSKYEKVCDLCHITLNKNAVFGDSSALAPGGARIGTPAMTSRGLLEKDFEKVGEFLHQAAVIALDVQKEKGTQESSVSTDCCVRFHSFLPLPSPPFPLPSHVNFYEPGYQQESC